MKLSTYVKQQKNRMSTRLKNLLRKYYLMHGDIEVDTNIISKLTEMKMFGEVSARELLILLLEDNIIKTNE